MKSPILFIFVFAITYCLNICDGADNDPRGQITTLMGTVQEQVNILKSSNEMKLSDTKTQLQKNTREIHDSAILEMRAHAQSKRMVEDNPCMSAAKDSLNDVVADVLKQFDDYVKIVKPKQSNGRQNIISKGEYVIGQCNKYLSGYNSRTFHGIIDKSFLKFEEEYINEKQVIDDFSKINNHAEELKKYLRERAQSIVRLAKQCMDSL